MYDGVCVTRAPNTHPAEGVSGQVSNMALAEEISIAAFSFGPGSSKQQQQQQHSEIRCVFLCLTKPRISGRKSAVARSGPEKFEKRTLLSVLTADSPWLVLGHKDSQSRGLSLNSPFSELSSVASLREISQHAFAVPYEGQDASPHDITSSSATS